MQILNWSYHDGKPGIAQGYAQENIYTVFQLKVSEFLTTRPHGHVDSWTFFRSKHASWYKSSQTVSFFYFERNWDGWFLPSSVTFYIIAHIAIQSRGVAWTSYIHITQTNKRRHTVLVYGPPRELNKDWATPWFVFFRSLVPILFNEPFSTLQGPFYIWVPRVPKLPPPPLPTNLSPRILICSWR